MAYYDGVRNRTWIIITFPLLYLSALFIYAGVRMVTVVDQLSNVFLTEEEVEEAEKLPDG